MSLNELTMPQRLRQGLVAYWPLDNVSRNLVTNGGFETNTTGWASHNTGALARITTQSKFGSACLEITGDAANEGAIFSGTGNAAQNTAYTASVWLKARDADDVGKFVQWFVQSQGGTFEIFTAPTLQLNADWTRYTLTLTWANASHTGWQLAVRFTGDPGGTFHILVDGVQYEQSDTATPYIETDGAAASRGGKSALWTPSSGPIDLTNNNGVTTTTGPSDNLPDAASFTRSSTQSLSSASSLFNPGINHFTVAAWVWHSTDATGTFPRVMGKRSGAANRGWELGRVESTGRFYFLATTDGQTIVSTTTGDDDVLIPDETWGLVFGWWNGARLYCQVNVNTPNPTLVDFTGPVFDSTADMHIGGNEIFWDGYITHVGFWNRVLSSQERSWLYNSGRGRDLSLS